MATHQRDQAVFRSVLPEDIDWKPFPAFPPSAPTGRACCRADSSRTLPDQGQGAPRLQTYRRVALSDATGQTDICSAANWGLFDHFIGDCKYKES